MNYTDRILLALILITGIVFSQDVFGDGSDGDLVVENGETYFSDQIKTHVLGNNSFDQNAILVNNTDGFSIGDEILIITMQDPTSEDFDQNVTGQFEFKIIGGISDGTISCTASLENSYNTSESRKHQVIRVPQYVNVTNNGTINGSWT